MKSIDQFHIIYPNDWKPASSKMKLRAGNEHVCKNYHLYCDERPVLTVDWRDLCCEGRVKCFRFCYLASAGCDCNSVLSRRRRVGFLVCMTSPCGEVTTLFTTVLKHDAGMLTAVQRLLPYKQVQLGFFKFTVQGVVYSSVSLSGDAAC